MTFRTTGLLVLMACSFGSLADGKMYRWTDAQGVTHYSDQPVASARELTTKPVVNAAASDSPAGSESAASKPSNASAQECERKRDQLGSYRTASKVSETDGLGNTRDYSPEEKQKLIEITEKAVHDLCGNS